MHIDMDMGAAEIFQSQEIKKNKQTKNKKQKKTGISFTKSNILYFAYGRHMN